jgi:hypothetical protein
VIEARDPVLLERMLPYLKRGKAIFFVGIMHCRELVTRLRSRGHAVSGPSLP